MHLGIGFKFEGDANTEPVTIMIERANLEGPPHAETVLARLASTEWKRDAASGSEHAPILVKPLESCPTTWLPPIAGVIEAICAGQDALLPPNVELDELLSTLEFYCVAIDPKDVDLEGANFTQQMRARLFLKQREKFAQAKEFILDLLKTHPKSLKSAPRRS